ncbi:hypothetical protein AB0M92_18970 [Streptomyces sp. NPDC051582]|uniref:hypothetical protein n=1 Tax=Streptomyces sp. NPDC051582 TaxID=3155167 RepID=UPI003421B738
MSLFRRTCKTTVYDVGFGNWNFRCTCGAHGRAIPQRAEIEEKARLHESAGRR